MEPGKLLLTPGTLWTSIQKTTAHALECGALLSIPTNFEFIRQDGVDFVVRKLANIERKKIAAKNTNSGQNFNPFLPYEQDLFVADISDSHVCILNKFNVVDYHLLIITRAFQEQESLLNLEDFVAMWACLNEFDGLVFYNAGKIAGASQRHKHLQLVPLPLVSSDVAIPMEKLLTSANFKASINTISALPFLHAFGFYQESYTNLPMTAAAKTLKLYHHLLNQVGLQAVNGKQSAPYNLLATREWMMIVPRVQEKFKSISVNSLGFAGSLLVTNEEQIEIIKSQGPMNILKTVGLPGQQ